MLFIDRSRVRVREEQQTDYGILDGVFTGLVNSLTCAQGNNITSKK